MSDIDPDNDPAGALAEANWILQRVSDSLGRTVDDDLRLRFPRGFLATAHQHRRRLPFIQRYLVEKNLAYSFMLSEIYWWILYRTDLAGTPADMVVKAALILQGAIAEAILVDVLSPTMGKRQAYKSRTKALVAMAIIDSELKEELDWLWDMRNKQHLYELDISEFDFYKRPDLERATAAVDALLAVLNTKRP